MTPPWPEVYAAVAATLPYWDRWGIDDGRPPAALAAAARYVADPTPATRAALAVALDGAQEAWLGTIQAEGERVAAGLPPGPERAASDVAFAILSLGQALFAVGTLDKATALRNATNHAQLAAAGKGY